MPGNVDERVVEMRIDNKQFESGAKTTISTLEKLERALHLKGDSDAIDRMARSVSNFDATPMANSIDKVSGHFDLLQIAGMRVIENLTDSIYNFATRTVKGLTIDQVSEGWDKYEKKTESVQSIMAATRDLFDDEAEQMKFVNDQLDRMMWFTDETSYNFVDMADNVGKFLAAGVGLGEGEDLSTPFSAMMGIASWGASAGAKPTEVSRAMYNISQAMGAGAMKAVDWKSIENAGMATLEFKQNVLDTAEAMGKIRKVGNDAGYMEDAADAIIKYSAAVGKADSDIKDKEVFDAKSFREGLSEGWFDTEVMTEVFKRYGEFADKLYEGTQATGEEATTLMEILDKYRSYLKTTNGEGSGFDWTKYAGKDADAIEALKKAIEDLEATQWEYSEQGFRMGQEAKTFSDAMDATKDAVSSKWMRTFQWVFGDYREAKDFWTEITDRLYTLFAEGGDMRNDILEAWYWAGGRNSLFNLDADNGPIGALWNLLDAIGTVAGPIRDAFYDVFGISDAEGLGGKLAELSERFREFTESLGFSEEAQQGLKNIFSVIFRGAKLVLEGIGSVIGIFGKFALGIGEVIDLLLSLASGNYTLEEAQEILMGSLYRILDFFLGIKDAIIGIPESLKKVAHYIEQVQAGWGPEFMEKSFNSLNGIEKVLARIGERFPALSSVLKIASEYFGKFIERIRTLKSGLPNAEALLASLTNYFTQLKNSLKGVNVDLSGAKGLLGRAGEFANVLLTALFGDMTSFKERASNFLSKAISFIVDIIKGIKISDVMSAVNAGIKLGFLGGLLDIVRSFHVLTNEFKSIPEAITDTLGSLQKSFESTSYLKIAVALGILAGAIYALSKVPSDDFMRVVLGLGILAMVLQKVSKGINIFSGSNNTGDTITKGLKANIKLMPDLAATILALAVALGVMAHAVVAFKKNGIGIGGLIAPIAMLIVTLGAMVGFLYLLKKFELKDVGKSFALLITVFTIIGKVAKMAKAVQDVPWYNLLITFIGMGAIIAALAVLMRFSSGFKKFKENQILHVAVLMAAVGYAVGSAAKSIVKLGSMPFLSMLQGLLGVGLLFGALYGLMALINKYGIGTGGNDTILKIAGSLALMTLSLTMLILPLMALSALPFVKMIGAIIGIAGLLAVLGGALVLIGKMGDANAGTMLKIAGALALISLGLMLVLPSLIVFMTFLVSLAAVLNGKMILKLLLLSGVMVLLGAGLVVAGVGVALLGVGLLAASVSALLFGAAILAIASALDKLGTAFPQLIQGLADAGKLMTAENAWNIGKGAIAFIALAAGIFLLAKAFGALFEKTDVIGKLGTFGGKLVSSIGTILRNVGTKITEHIPELLKVLAALGVAAGLYLIGAIPKIASFAVQAILTLFESIHQGIRANKGVLEHSIFGMVEVVLEIILDSGTWIFSVIRGLISTVATGILNWVAEQVEKIDLFGIGEKLGKTIRGIADDLPSTEEIMKQWSDQKSSNEEWLQQFVPPAGELQDISQTVPENIGTGILAGQSSVDDAITTVKDSALSIVGMLPPAMETNGKDAMSGLNTGIVNFWNSGVIQDNLSTITDGINLQTRLGLGERSPSKIAAEAGAFYVIGLAQGIADNAKLPLDAIDDTTDPMAEALRNAMMQVATVADDDFEFTPTITPVVDLSNVGYAAGSIGSMFGNASLSASLSRSSAAQASRYSNGSYGSGNNAVISEMQGLGARVDALGAAITNMQIVLDSGVLVGATSAKMDARLGLLAVRKGRGN